MTAPLKDDLPGVSVKSIRRADDGPPQTAQVVVCKTCSTEHPIFNARSTLLPPDALSKRAAAAGWRFDRRGAHVCPKCIEAEKDAKMVDKAPREPRPEDNRAIFQRLFETYDTKNARYCDDYTDHSVAKSLGVPRAWVEAIRETSFGPAGKNLEMDRALVSLGELRAEVEKATSDALVVAEAYEALGAKIEAERKRIDALVEAVGPRRAAK